MNRALTVFAVVQHFSEQSVKVDIKEKQEKSKGSKKSTWPPFLKLSRWNGMDCDAEERFPVQDHRHSIFKDGNPYIRLLECLTSQPRRKTAKMPMMACILDSSVISDGRMSTRWPVIRAT
jgi:hypothetical protein